MNELVNKIEEHKFLSRREKEVEGLLELYIEVELGSMDVAIGVGKGMLEVRKDDYEVKDAIRDFYEGVRLDIKVEKTNLEKEIEGLVGRK